MYEKRVNRAVEIRREAGLPPHFCRREIVSQYIPRHPTPGKRYVIPVRGSQTDLVVSVQNAGVICLKYGDVKLIADVSFLRWVLKHKSDHNGRKPVVLIEIEMTTLRISKQTFEERLAEVLKP